ncbi:MAG TPA: heme o synthase [Steroidobacteraceae bacterium]|nr:heme o synthase [Steroidobacteraceae bacterium]
MNSVAAPAVQTADVPVPAAAWRVALGVFKPRIALEIMLAGLAGVVMAGGEGLEWWRLMALAVGIFGAAGAAGALNQLAERDLDARMSRTRARPFATGAFRPGAAWYSLVAAVALVAVATVGFATRWPAAVYVFLGAFTYGVVYTLWLKRRTWLNIVIGGLAGSFAVLAGAAAVDPSPGPAAWVFAVVLFLWTPPHFWSLAMYYRQDYAAAGVPMLPVVFGDPLASRVIFAHTVPLAMLSLLPLAWGGLGWVYALGALAGGAYFVFRAWRLVRDVTPRNAIQCFLASLLQLGVLLAAALVDGALHGALVRL